MTCYISEELQPRIGISRTMEQLEFDCAAVVRSFHAAADAAVEGLPLPAIRECLAQLVREAEVLKMRANNQINYLDETFLEAAE